MAKTKILAAGCIHSDVKLANALAERAEKESVDLVILCGDVTYSDFVPEGLIAPFIKKNKKVLIVPGNHESLATIEFLADLYHLVNLHGYAITHKDIGIFGCGSANIGINQMHEEEIYTLFKNGFEKIKDAKKKIMVTHVHPIGTMMEKFSDIVPGSTGVRRALDAFKPDFLLCSHVHEAEGIEEKIGNTKIVNVVRSGKVIEV